jgi:hypothetical protein
MRVPRSLIYADKTYLRGWGLQAIQACEMDWNHHVDSSFSSKEEYNSVHLFCKLFNLLSSEIQHYFTARYRHPNTTLQLYTLHQVKLLSSWIPSLQLLLPW